MSPSRIFILRPVATSLMMAGVVLVGVVASGNCRSRRCPVDYRHHADPDVLPWREPGGGDVFDHRAARETVRAGTGTDEMTSISSFGSSLITLQFSLDLNIDIAEQEVQAAINAATSFLPTNLPVPPVYSKTNPADAPILTLALTLFDSAAAESRRAGGNAHGAEDFATQGSGAGEHQRRAAAGRPGAGESHRARVLWIESGDVCERRWPAPM